MVDFKHKKGLNPAQAFARSEKLRQKKRNRLEKERQRKELEKKVCMQLSIEDHTHKIPSTQPEIASKKSGSITSVQRSESISKSKKPCRQIVRPCVITHDDRVILSSVTINPDHDDDDDDDEEEDDSDTSSTGETDSETENEQSPVFSNTMMNQGHHSSSEGNNVKSSISGLAFVARQAALSRLNDITAKRQQRLAIDIDDQSSNVPHTSSISNNNLAMQSDDLDLDPMVKQRLEMLKQNPSRVIHEAGHQYLVRNLNSAHTILHNSCLGSSNVNYEMFLEDPPVSPAIASHMKILNNESSPELISEPPLATTCLYQQPPDTSLSSKITSTPGGTAPLFVPTALRLQNKRKIPPKEAGVFPRAFGRASLAQSARSTNSAMVSSSVMRPSVSTTLSLDNEKNLEKEFRSFMEEVFKSIQ